MVLYDENGKATSNAVQRPTRIMIPIEVLQEIRDYADHLLNTGMGKKKSFEFLGKFIDGKIKEHTE